MQAPPTDRCLLPARLVYSWDLQTAHCNLQSSHSHPFVAHHSDTALGKPLPLILYNIFLIHKFTLAFPLVSVTVKSVPDTTAHNLNLQGTKGNAICSSFSPPCLAIICLPNDPHQGCLLSDLPRSSMWKCIMSTHSHPCYMNEHSANAISLSCIIKHILLKDHHDVASSLSLLVNPNHR